MSELKCFRIDDGSEHFHYAARTEEQVLEEYRSTWGSVLDGNETEPKVREVPFEEMETRKVQMEDENQFPDGLATLKQCFDDACKVAFEGAIEICSSIY